MRRKKIFYYSVHEVLEHDDLRILTNAGYDVFSYGSYASPDARGNRFRTSDVGFADPADFHAATHGGTWRDADNRLCFSKPFIDRFDISIINHDPFVVIHNLDALSDRPIVFRTLGQTTRGIEDALRPFADRIAVCRYDARESHPDHLKTDAVIRFGKYLDEFPDWTGGDDFLLTFMNIIKRPMARPIYDDYRAIVDGYDSRLHGMDNEGIENYAGLATPDEQLNLFKTCRAYVYVNSLVASYTLNFMEALIVGAPIIAPSASFTMSPPYADWWPERYAIEEMLSGGAGLVYSSIAEARDIISGLGGRDLAAMSHRARTRAAELFDARVIEGEWRSFIEALT